LVNGDLFASGQKLLREGVPPHVVPQRMRISAERWAEISAACSVRVVGLPLET
jgi:hypothetical protein